MREYYYLKDFDINIVWNGDLNLLSKTVKIKLSRNKIDFIEYFKDKFNFIKCGFCGEYNKTFVFLFDIDNKNKEISIIGIKYPEIQTSLVNALYYCYHNRSCPGKKLNGNSVDFISTTRNISKEEAKEFIHSRNSSPFYKENHSSEDEYKKSQKRDKNWYEENGKDYDAIITQRKENTCKEGLIRRHGEEKANEICASKSVTLENLLKKYPEKEANEIYDNWKKSINHTEENFIKRYGDNYLYHYMKFLFKSSRNKHLKSYETYDEFVDTCNSKIVSKNIESCLFYLKNTDIEKCFIRCKWVYISLKYFEKTMDDLIEDIKKINPKIHSLDSIKTSRGVYISYTENGSILRSSHEIIFYKNLISNGLEETKDFIINGTYPNSRLFYDFYFPKIDLYVEIAGFMYDDDYKEKMNLKNKQFKSKIILPKNIEIEVKNIIRIINGK